MKAVGQPAVELGCGDGDPLLDLVASGLDVEGLDSSPDMLGRCREAATARGLEVVLHAQPMQSMELGRRYRSIYLAGPTFNLLPDDEVALAALQRIEAHLTADGAALIPLFVPLPTGPDDLGRIRSRTTEDGTILRFSALSEHRDEEARLHVSVLRYEVEAAGETIVEERPWVLHWYTQHGFAELVEAAGLRVDRVLAPDGRPATADDLTFAFRLTAREAR